MYSWIKKKWNGANVEKQFSKKKNVGEQICRVACIWPCGNIHNVAPRIKAVYYYSSNVGETKDSVKNIFLKITPFKFASLPFIT